MSTAATPWPKAWEPLTPRGVASFASASLSRLLLIQCLVALLAAAMVLWFFYHSWFPVVRHAIQQLPAQGEIRGGQMDWNGDNPVQLAKNRWLGLSVDLNHSGQLARESHLQLELGRKNLRLFYMLGYVVIDYPPDRYLPLNRTQADPWWGAWEPWILVGVAASTFIFLLVSWTALATIYCAPVRLITFFENRDLNWRQSWRLAGAALMPGALFLTFGILCYALGWIDMLQLAGVAGLHILVSWIYLLISPLFLPRHATATPVVSANPFAAKRTPDSQPPPQSSVKQD